MGPAAFDQQRECDWRQPRSVDAGNGARRAVLAAGSQLWRRYQITEVELCRAASRTDLRARRGQEDAASRRLQSLRLADGFGVVYRPSLWRIQLSRLSRQ